MKKPLPPAFDYNKWAKDMPDNKSSQLEIDKFWDREFARWREGYNSLTPQHYFYLTQIKIKNAIGLEIRPFWRDVDQLIFEAYRECTKKNKDLLIVKRRGVGLSSIFAGIIPIFTCLVYPGSVNLITSADKDRIKDLFMNKTLIAYDNLDQEIKPERSSTRTDGYLNLSKKASDGTYTGLKSLIVCKETVKKPNAFETYRAKSIFLDEFFLHPKANKVRSSAQACVKDDFVKIAPIVLGGSAGIVSKEGAKLGRQLWQDAQNLDIVNLFLPGWMGVSSVPELKDGEPTGKILNFCPNGHSQKDKAVEYIEKRREKLIKASDKDPYYTYVKEYPLSIEEIFELHNEGALPDDIIEKLSIQEKIILNTPPPIGTYNLVKKVTGEIIAEPDIKGWVKILEHPQPNSHYIASTDPIPFGDSNINDGSDNVLIIKDRGKETYIAIYKERNLDAEEVVNRMLLVQYYYNDAKNFLETNQGKVIYEKYRDMKVFDMLANRVMMLGIRYSDVRMKKGWYKNEKTGARANAFFLDYLKQHSDKIWFQEIIDELKSFLSDNTDIVDAMLGGELYDADLTKIDIKNTARPEYREIRQIVRDSRGRTSIEWKKVRVS